MKGVSMSDRTRTILAGDVGGTKTLLSLYSVAENPRLPMRKSQYPSRDFDSLEEILKEFLKGEQSELILASFDVAGPVVQGKSRITNLPWVIERSSLSDLLQVPVVLMNDMDAISTAVAHVEQIRSATLQVGNPVDHGRRAVIAPGTGLGEGFLVWSHGRYLPFGTEGGHTDFGPRNEIQVRLLEYLQGRIQHVSYEWVCSGLGIQNLYAFLRDSENYPEPDWLGKEFVSVKDPTPLIVQTALENGAPICSAALDLFVDILANETSNLALKILAVGGVFLAGGIPRRILPWLDTPKFRDAFAAKGRFQEFLKGIPLYVVLEPEAALIGAAWAGFDQLNGGKYD